MLGKVDGVSAVKRYQLQLLSQVCIDKQPAYADPGVDAGDLHGHSGFLARRPELVHAFGRRQVRLYRRHLASTALQPRSRFFQPVTR